ncbi:unnamed protein product [Hermetia illucens]|uniref:Uncharacterized protein n=1 Tax=Hermetia illucens TaxID=343691 RepID=A0A7R8V2N0_HERIL|nr:unnamed protein product [Hermetia illucens]
MAAVESSLSIFIAVTLLMCNMCFGGVVYVQYSRRVPSQFPGDKYVEEVVEEFEIPQIPLYYGYSDRDVQVLLQNSLGRGTFPLRGQPAFQQPTDRNIMPSSTTTEAPYYVGTTTERSFFNWLGQSETTTTSTTSTTSSPLIFTTKSYENSNPDYNQLIPTISVEVIPPSTTTPREFSITYDDHVKEKEDDDSTTEATTGPTKVSIPTLDNTNNNEVDAGNTEQNRAETITTTEPYYEEEETYEDNYDYEDGNAKENEDKATAETSTALALTAATEATTKASLFSLFG